MRSGTLGVLAAALAIGSTGCGGGSEPTRAEFIKQADAICKENRTSDARFVSANAGAARSSARAMAQFVLTLVARDEEKVKKLAVLEPPAALKVDYDAYLRTLRSLNEMARDVVRLAPPSATGDVAPGTAAAKVNDERTGKAHTAFNRAHALGFKFCGA